MKTIDKKDAEFLDTECAKALDELRARIADKCIEGAMFGHLAAIIANRIGVLQTVSLLAVILHHGMTAKVTDTEITYETVSL